MAKPKRNNKTILIIVAAIILIGLLSAGAYFAFAQPKNDSQPQGDNSGLTSGQSSETLTPSKDSTSTTVVKGSYQIYEPSKLTLASEGQVVLFFNAKWCPECQKANANFQEETIPDGLTILSVDYDKFTDLKKQYGVTYQHTFVQVDASGKQIKKWSGSSTVSDVEKNIQK